MVNQALIGTFYNTAIKLSSKSVAGKTHKQYLSTESELFITAKGNLPANKFLYLFIIVFIASLNLPCSRNEESNHESTCIVKMVSGFFLIIFG